MEWKNDILSFSGFDYGVAKQKQDEISYNEQVSIKSKSLSLVEKGEPTIEEQANLNDLISNERDPDPMDERAIENVYFRNVERAERKLKYMLQLKEKLAEPRKVDEIESKIFLKPICHENPWKDTPKKSRCTIS